MRESYPAFDSLDSTPDRSMVTVDALVASGQTAQITYFLNRAMDNGPTQDQAGEVLTQMAFLRRLA